MKPIRPRLWRSDFANRVKESAGTRTVEEAVAQLVNVKVGMLGKPTPPIDLPIIASVCGIEPKITEVTMKHDARLIPNNGKFYIEVNASHSIGRRRFSTGHEITHKILSKNKAFVSIECTDIGSYSHKVGKAIDRVEEEWLCDLGASQILLLTPEYLTPIRLDLGFSFQMIEYIEKTFKVSFEAASRSLIETSFDEAAIVFFAPGLKKNEAAKTNQLILLPGYVDSIIPKLRIVRSYTSERFSMNLRSNKSVPEHSCM